MPQLRRLCGGLALLLGALWALHIYTYSPVPRGVKVWTQPGGTAPAHAVFRTPPAPAPTAAAAAAVEAPQSPFGRFSAGTEPPAPATAPPQPRQRLSPPGVGPPGSLPPKQPARGPPNAEEDYQGRFPHCYGTVSERCKELKLECGGRKAHQLPAVLANRARVQTELAAEPDDPKCPPLDDYVFPWPPKEIWSLASARELPEYPLCGWTPEDGQYSLPTYTSGRAQSFTGIIDLFNDLNLTVTLKGGTALGAIRHGGPIPADRDMDVVLPVWLNLDRFCPQAQVDGRPVISKGGYMCALTRDEWVDKALAFLTPHLNKRKMKARKTNYGGLRLIGNGLSPVDFVVSVYDAWVLANDKGGGICRCYFAGVYALCVENEHAHMRNEYGPTYMRPDRASAARP